MQQRIEMPTSRAAVSVLGVYPVAQAPANDAESAISVTPLPHTSATALITVGNVHGRGSHVNTTESPSAQAAVSVLGVYPVSQLAVHNCPWSVSVIPLSHTFATALITVGNAHGRGSRVNTTKPPSVHAAVSVLSTQGEGMPVEMMSVSRHDVVWCSRLNAQASPQQLSDLGVRDPFPK